MLKIKNILSVFLLFFAGSFSYAEYKNNAWPHVQFKKDKELSYRIEGNVPYLGIVNFREASIQTFPINDKGIFISAIVEKKYYEWNEPKYCARLTIIPAIIFINQKTQMLISKKGGDMYWENYEIFAANCEAYAIRVYTKGLYLLVNDINSPNRFTEVYLELKDDGKYYEQSDDTSLGKIIETYQDFYNISSEDNYRFVNTAQYPGFDFFILSEKNKAVDRIILQGIKYFNKTENGIEFITPYGSGFYSFETEQINLVDKSNYVGKTFNYFKWNHIGWWYHGKISKKIITQDDFNFVPGGF